MGNVHTVPGGFFWLGEQKFRVDTWNYLSIEEFVRGEKSLNEGGAGFPSII